MADRCRSDIIRTVAITPSKSQSQDFEVVKRVCQTSTLAGINAIHQAGPAKPFRFLYMSGAAAERDQTKTPRFLPQYLLMRVRQSSIPDTSVFVPYTKSLLEPPQLQMSIERYDEPDFDREKRIEYWRALTCAIIRERPKTRS